MGQKPTFDVLSYGTIGMDNILRIPHFPGPDISTHTSDSGWYLGGKATNTAAHLTTWGLSVAISGTVIGHDEVGARLDAALKRYPRINTTYLERRDDLTSMYCCILVAPDGERAIIGVGADEVPQSPPTAAMMDDVRLLTLDLYGGDERVEAARLAKAAGIPVVVGDVRDADHPVLDYVVVAIASAAELRADAPEGSLDGFARRVQAHGVGTVIITQGSKAVLVYDRDHDSVSIAPPQVNAVDATGAGDAFRAGVVYGLLQGWTMVKVTQFAATAASLSIQERGAAENPPTLDQIRASMQSMGYGSLQ